MPGGIRGDPGRQNADILPKDTAEIRIIGKAAQDRRFLDTVATRFQQPPGMGTADGIKIVIGGLAGDSFKFPLEMEFAHAYTGGNIIVCKFSGKVGLHIKQGLIHPFQSIGIGRLLLIGCAVITA